MKWLVIFVIGFILYVVSNSTIEINNVRVLSYFSMKDNEPTRVSMVFFVVGTIMVLVGFGGVVWNWNS